MDQIPCAKHLAIAIRSNSHDKEKGTKARTPTLSTESGTGTQPSFSFNGSWVANVRRSLLVSAVRIAILLCLHCYPRSTSPQVNRTWEYLKFDFLGVPSFFCLPNQI